VTQQEGLQDTVATLGTALTSQHAAMLSRYADEVILLFDSDAAGNNAAKRAIDALAETELSVRVSTLPDGKDPDEFILQHGLEKFEEFIRTKSRSMIEFLSAHAVSAYGADTPEKKARCIAEILPVAAKIKNSVIRYEWVKYLAEKFRTAETAVEEELKKLTGKPRKDSGKPAEQSQRKSFMTHVRSAEEEILQILLSSPQHAGIVEEVSFKDGLNRQILSMIKKGMRADDIASQLDEKDMGWFTELVLEEKEYDKPEEMIAGCIKDIHRSDMESQKKELEREISAMSDGKIPHDEVKESLYRNLVRQLKGSVKI
jgi:DNA primase